MRSILVAAVYAGVVGLLGERAWHAETWPAAIFFGMALWLGVSIPLGIVIGSAMKVGGAPEGLPVSANRIAA